MVKRGTLHLDNINLQMAGLDDLFLAPLGVNDDTFLNLEPNEDIIYQEYKSKKKPEKNNLSKYLLTSLLFFLNEKL